MLSCRTSDVDRDDPGEQHADDDDPGDPAGERRARAAASALRAAAPRAAARRALSAIAAHDVLTATRRRAEAARGLTSSSAADGRTGLRVSRRSSGSLPQTQTGKSGGHVQPFARSRHELLHDPVLERVEADHRETPTRAQHLERGGKRRLELAQLVVDGDAQRLEDALGGWPSPKRAGVGIAGLITSTRSPVRKNGRSARRRTIARAIGPA